MCSSVTSTGCSQLIANIGARGAFSGLREILLATTRTFGVRSGAWDALWTVCVAADSSSKFTLIIIAVAVLTLLPIFRALAWLALIIEAVGCLNAFGWGCGAFFGISCFDADPVC